MSKLYRSRISRAERLLRYLGAESIAWSIRKYHVPISPYSLVLEVGSGGNPFPRSNVLLDAYEATRERHWVPLIADRPMVLGFVENLPCKDKAFDFVIASHVLEHSADPEKFLNELQRVASAGYIEVPDAFFERINPYRDHRLEISSMNNRLIILKKKNWVVDEYLRDLYEKRVKKIMTSTVMRKYPYDFHVRFYWENDIEYTVVNPEVNATWQAPLALRNEIKQGIMQRLRARTRDVLRYFFSQNARNHSLDILHLLRCTECYGGNLHRQDLSIKCRECGKSFSCTDGMIVMNKMSAK